MSFLSAWLSQIVMILLFAVVMDLVVPTSSMRNYVKVVMGFVIMVTMLKPVSVLYENRFDISRIGWPESDLKIENLDTIKAKAADLQSEQNRIAERELGGPLQKTIKAQLESRYPLEVTGVGVRLSEPGKEPVRSVEIKELTVTVRPKRGGSGENGMDPVQPVVIQVERESEPAGRKSSSTEPDKMLRQIHQELADTLQIPESAVSIRLAAD